MKDSYSIVVDGAGKVSEHKLGNHAAGTALKPMVTAVSSKVVAGERTVVLTRRLKGTTPDYFSFDVAASVLPMINAVGSTAAFGYHKTKTATSLVLLPAAATGTGGACICAHEPAPFGAGKGSFVYSPVKSDRGEKGQAIKLGFTNRCAPQPRGDLLAQRNPTCDVRAYTGGQSACHHMFSLLDADQPNPWPDKPINYTMKWRFWYQEYDPDYHSSIQYSHLGESRDYCWHLGRIFPKNASSIRADRERHRLEHRRRARRGGRGRRVRRAEMHGRHGGLQQSGGRLGPHDHGRVQD